MRQIAVLALALILLSGLALAACTGSSPGQPAAQPEPIEAEPPDEAPTEAEPPGPKVCAEDFVLTISVEEASLLQGEDFRVNVELKNNGGEGREIGYSILFWPSIPGWYPFGGIAIDPPEPQSRFLEAGATIQNIGVWGNEVEEWLIGSDLEPGKHELRFRASFWLLDDEQSLEVWSDTVLLTVQ